MIRPKVVIIEGDEDARYLYNIALEFQNLNVLSAPTFREGLVIVGQIQPDLLLMDQMVVDFKDFDIMKEITSVCTDKVPMIIVTNLKEESHRHKEELKVMNAFEYLVSGKNTVGDVIRSSRKAIEL